MNEPRKFKYEVEVSTPGGGKLDSAQGEDLLTILRKIWVDFYLECVTAEDLVAFLDRARTVGIGEIIEDFTDAEFTVCVRGIYS